MTNPIKQHIDTELPPGGARAGLDTETVMRFSKSRRTKRRLAGGGAVLAAVAAVVAVVLSVSTLAPGGANGSPDDAANDKRTEEGQYPYDEYFWSFANGPEYKDEITDASKEYTYAFWKYVEENLPEATFVDGNGDGVDGRKEHTGDRAKDGFFGTMTEVMIEGDERDPEANMDGEPVKDRKTLAMYERFEPGKGFNGTSCCGLTFLVDKGKVRDVNLGVSVLPEGTFTKGTKDIMDPSYFGPDIDHEIDTKTVDGDVLEAIELRTTGDADEGTVDTLRYAVVVYRADDTAIVVTASSGADGSDDVGDSLTHEDLAGIAMALPRVPLP